MAVIHGVTSYSTQTPAPIWPLSSREVLIDGFVAQVIPVSLHVVPEHREIAGPLLAASTTQNRSFASWAGPLKPLTVKRR